MAGQDPLHERDRQDAVTLELPPVLARANSPGKLAFLKGIVQNGIDPVSLIASVVESPALQKIYDNVEIQHRIIESNPLLSGVKGFKDAAGRGLDDLQTTHAFKVGVKELLELLKATETTVKDPSASIKVLNDLVAAGDVTTKELMAAAKQGDASAVESLKRIASSRLFPGVDIDKIQEIHEAANFDTILNSPEMFYIDQDKEMSEAFR